MAFNILDLQKIGRAYRHVQRYRDILAVLARHGFHDTLHKIKGDYTPAWLQKVRKASIEEEAAQAEVMDEEGAPRPLTLPERFRLALEELGPTFVKIGQILSTRPDLLPVEYIEELKNLQDDLPAFPFEKVREIIEEEFGHPLEELYLRFENKPIAAASIGQAHRAWLHGGEPVIVKVQRPGIQRQMEVDLEILLYLAGLAEENVESMKVHRPRAVMEGMIRALEAELNFENEATRLDHFADLYNEREDVYFPTVYPELSGKRILTMERIEGIKSGQVEKIKELGLDTEALATSGAEFVLEQILIHGHFHGDPHPGNIFVLEDGRLCFIDFGMTGRLDVRMRRYLADLLQGAAEQNPRRTADALIRIADYDLPPKRGPFENDVAEFLTLHCSRDLSRFKLERFLYEMVALSERHLLTIPSDIYIMIKALSSMEDVARKMHPEIDIIGLAQPVVQRAWLKRIEMDEWVRRGLVASEDLLDSVPDMPRRLGDAFDRLVEGRMRIQLEHQGITRLVETLDKVGNRLSYAIVLAALLIGSSVVVLAGIPPKWHDIPLLGLFGFVIAAIMSGWLLFSITKRGLR